MARTDTLGNFLTDVADAIREKKGTTNTIPASEFDTEISSIETGGTSPIKVTFCDYDGTELYKIPINELTELPPLPEHEGLICQGWNWDLEDIINENKPLIVGANYITDNGETRIYIHLEEKYSPNIYFSASGDVTLDYGDGVIETVRSINKKHNYPGPGDYIIRIKPINDGTTFSISGSTSSTSVLYSNLISSSISTGQPRDNVGYNNSVTKIELGSGSLLANGACLQMMNLQSITLHNNISTTNRLGNYCFNKCNSLKFVVIPKGIVTLGTNAFNGSGIETVSLPNGLQTLDSSCFNSCYDLREICLPNTTTNILTSCFQNCYSLKTIHMSKNLTTLSMQAFMECRSLEEITIPEGITSIPTQTFQYCWSLRKVNWHDNIIQLDKNAFYQCNSLSEITIPSKLEIMGEACFRECRSLTINNLPDTLIEIGPYALHYCDISELTIPDGVVDLPTNAIGYTGLQKITLPKYMNSIMEYNFVNSQLEEFTMPMGITSVPSSTFTNSQQLRKITLSDTVEKVDIYAFNECNSLERIIFGANTTTINGYSSTLQLYSLVSFDFSRVKKIPSLSYNITLPIRTHKIEVPAYLYDDWITRSDWSKLISYIVGVGRTYGYILDNGMVDDIAFNTTHNITFSLKGMEVLPDINVVSNLCNYAIEELTLDKCVISITPKGITGDDTITVNITYDGEVMSETFTTTVWETIPEPVFTLDSRNATYTFELGDDGYYASTNQNINNSYSICRVNVEVAPMIDYILIDYDLDSQAYYDYAIISNQNTALTMSYSADSTYYTRIKSDSSTINKLSGTIEYPTNGLTNFYFDIKYRKDGSTNTGTDTFKFKLSQKA